MRIGILEAGSVNKKLIVKHGSYGTMFEELFQKLIEGSSFNTVKLINGEFPRSAFEADLWIITGSRFGVYDNLPWLKPLKVFLEKCLEERIPIFGVCFGHQLLAEVLGGKVEKFKRGWSLGVSKYQIDQDFSWTSNLPQKLNVYSFHQDQIVETPKGSTVIAFSNFCKNAILAYGKPNSPYAISIQSHPEFNQEYMGDLIRLRKDLFCPKSVPEKALKSLQMPVKNEILVKNITYALLKHK